MNLGYIPVAKSIDIIKEDDKSFFREFNSAFLENFHKGHVYIVRSN